MAGCVEPLALVPCFKLHIADAAAEKIKAKGMSKVDLLGRRFTMEDDFYKGRLSDRHGLEVVVPAKEEREIVHRIICDELCLGTKIHAEAAVEYALER